MAAQRTLKSQPIRVMIVEDHPLLIQGFQRVVEQEPDLTPVAEVTDGQAAVDKALELLPDVILMDINLPKKNGLQATREIKRSRAGETINIIILTAYHDDEQLFHALSYGASAYFPKDVRPTELLPAIRAVAQGKRVIKNKIMDYSQAFLWLMQHTEERAPLGDASGDSFAPLSPREMEILFNITCGLSNREIAQTLSISHQTVKNHISSILRKLNVDDRTQAAVTALRRGWIRLDETNPSQ